MSISEGDSNVISLNLCRLFVELRELLGSSI